MDTGLGGWRRTHHNGDLRKTDVDQTVTLMGWVHRRRDHGQLIFIDLRDRFGLTQVVLDPAIAPETLEIGNELRNECVIAVTGKVAARPDGMVNDKMPTGEIEMHVTTIKLLSPAAVLPFPVNQDEANEAGETLRLTHRYLDLRRESIRDKIVQRSQISSAFRRALEAEGFLDIETPYLYKSTPEGAREFLVPSRVNPGAFYALPQSPQLFKQTLMMASFDRYYQVVKCFRDEDLRADRQPEFTQVDCEMSFAEQEEVLETFERVVNGTLEGFSGKPLADPITRITYDEAMGRYGVDKPDLRFDLPLHELTSTLSDAEFRVFAEAISSGGIVNALCVKGGAEKFSRKDIDGLTEIAKTQGAKGLAWAKRKEGSGAESWQSPIAKFLSETEIDGINNATGSEAGDLLLFGAGSYDTTKASLGLLRNHLGRALSLYDPRELKFAWVLDFPLLEHDPDAKRWIARHHPFTMPQPQDVEKLATDPGSVKAAAYDLVLNGHEVAGGSIRIHDYDLQSQLFGFLGLSAEEAEAKFGFLLRALSYGAPPHGGIAFGLDRFVMCLLGTEAIRDVIAFPKTQRATCLMTGSPSQVPREDLQDLHVRVQMPATTE